MKQKQNRKNKEEKLKTKTDVLRINDPARRVRGVSPGGGK